MTINEQIEQAAKAISKQIGEVEPLSNQEQFDLNVCKAITDLVIVINNLEARISVLEGWDE